MSLFTPSDTDTTTFIREHPLAVVTSGYPGGYMSTPLPLIFEGAGTQYLIGHFARANPHVKALKENGQALALFMGHHGFISPSWMKDRTQAPTWNYQICKAALEIEFDESSTAADHAVGMLTAHMESGRDKAWTPDEMGSRYERLIRGIVAFRARIVSLEAKFKLGQNERDDVFLDICDGLERSGDFTLQELMRKARA